MQLISQFELKKLIEGKRDFKLVEALAPDKFQHAHLPGAINIPPDKIGELAPKLLPQKDAQIVVYCASPAWHASENAGRELAQMGYTNIRDYKGGKAEWIKAGLPIEAEHLIHTLAQRPSEMVDASTEPQKDAA